VSGRGASTASGRCSSASYPSFGPRCPKRPPHRSLCWPRCARSPLPVVGIARRSTFDPPGAPPSAVHPFPVPFSKPKPHHRVRRVPFTSPSPLRRPQTPWNPSPPRLWRPHLPRARTAPAKAVKPLGARSKLLASDPTTRIFGY
jgi:hypothetical protein